MIAAVAQKTSWGLDKLTFNWFDLAVVLIIVFGLWRGRKHGMTKELLPASQWVVLVAAAGLGHPFLADWLMHADIVKSVFGKNFTGRPTVLISSYVIIALLVVIIFVVLRRRIMEFHPHRWRRLQVAKRNPGRRGSGNPVVTIAVGVLMPTAAVINLVAGVINVIVLNHERGFHHRRNWIHPHRVRTVHITDATGLGS